MGAQPNSKVDLAGYIKRSCAELTVACPTCNKALEERSDDLWGCYQCNVAYLLCLVPIKAARCGDNEE